MPTRLATGWKPCGSVNVARTPERWQVLQRQAALALVNAMDPELEVEGEMHGDAALDEEVRMRAFPGSRLKGEANLLIMPTADAANIAFNLLKTSQGKFTTECINFLIENGHAEELAAALGRGLG